MVLFLVTMATGYFGEGVMLVLNSDVTLARLMNDVEFVCELYSTYLDMLEDRIRRMGLLIDAEDFEPLWREAHGLKGASGTINADKMHACAYDVELAARKGEAAVLHELKANFEDVAKETAQALRSWIANHT